MLGGEPTDREKGTRFLVFPFPSTLNPSNTCSRHQRVNALNLVAWLYNTSRYVLFQEICTTACGMRMFSESLQLTLGVSSRGPPIRVILGPVHLIEKYNLWQVPFPMKTSMKK